MTNLLKQVSRLLLSGGYSYVINPPANIDMLLDGGGLLRVITPPDNTSMAFTEIFHDPIENQFWEGRGWYDYPEGGDEMTLSSDGAILGSTQSLDMTWDAGDNAPEDTNRAMRLAFTATDNIYLRYYVKYLAGWVGSETTYHPHEFYFVTNKDPAYTGLQGGLSGNDLTLYVEQNDLQPRLAYANVNNPSNGAELVYDADAAVFMSVDTWYKIEIFIKLNTYTGSTANADGIFKYWLDESLEININNAMPREGAGNSDMLIDQFIIAPWIGPGSSKTQTCLYDDIVLGVETGDQTVAFNTVQETNTASVISLLQDGALSFGQTVETDSAQSIDVDSGDPIIEGIFTDGQYLAFDYPSECRTGGGGGYANCHSIADDGMDWAYTGSGDTVNGNHTELLAAASAAAQTGGMPYGLRMWQADGSNLNTNQPYLYFGKGGQNGTVQNEKELWIRAYIRYMSGYEWAESNPLNHKWFYLYHNKHGASNSDGQINLQPYWDGFRMVPQAGGGSDGLVTDVDWQSVFGNTSDGLFHMFEFHYKMDTNSNNGIAQMWVDGVLKLDMHSFDWSGGDGDDFREGIGMLKLFENQKHPANGSGGGYSDMADLEIWNTTPPATDDSGDSNPWIGPLGGFYGGS